MEKVLVTGASGFIGSFIVEEGLKQGFEVWAAVRGSSSRQYLRDERIRFIELDLSSQARLVEQLQGQSFDYVVHAAGVTKCKDKQDFFRVNTDGTRNLVGALLQLAMPVKRLIYLSSLSIFGPIREEQPYQEILDTDTPRPNTAYGESKLQAEKALKEMTEGKIPTIILRPTGVYGPREKDYFLMAKSIKGHVDFSVGWKQQDITFVYVRDVVQAVYLAFTKGTSGKAYFLSDGEVYQSSAFSDLIIREMGRPWCLRVNAPLWVLRVATFFGEWLGRLTGKVTALNKDKYHILSQRNWRCDITPARRELGYDPQWQLERGVKETINWYQQEGWL